MVTQEDLLEISEQVSSGFEKWSEENGENDIEHYGERLEQYLKSEELLSILRSSLEGILKRAADNVEQADLSSISDELEAAYQIYAEENGLPVRDAISDALKEYLYSEEAGNIINDNILSKIDTSEVEMKVKEAIAGMAASYTDKVQEQIVKMMAGSEAGGAIESAMNSLMQQIAGSVSSAISSQMSSIMGGLTAGIRDSVSSALEGYITKMTESMGSAFAIDSDALRDAVKMNMDQDELKDLLSSMMSGTSSTYDRNMKAFGYADFDKPYSILIYPRNFESKDVLTNMLEEYNLNMEESGQEEKVITYTDLVGTMMSSVTVIINAISYVLIAFVSISLVVSSIMIGIITYISVLERTKEIGILRAIGASKKDISHVFNAEAITMGIIITLLLNIPINMIILNLTEIDNIAKLPVKGAVILVVISMMLTFIAGLVPSSIAAKKDPVEALRTE